LGLGVLSIAVTLVVGILIGVTATIVVVRRPTGDREADAWAGFIRELERARRYERPFVVARAPNSAARPDARGSHPHRPPDLPLRRTDEVWSVGADVYALLPEATPADAARWRQRLAATQAFADIRVASFPDDGLTTGALLSALGDLPATGDLQAVPDGLRGPEPMRRIS
jgi:hypothetical protein